MSVSSPSTPNARRITMGRVRGIVEYWDNEQDPPMPRAKLRNEFDRLFGEECPV